jgi:hypothetical protein
VRAITRLTRNWALLATSIIAVLLAGGLLWLHSRALESSQHACPASTTVIPTWTPGGGAGHQSSQPVSGPPKTSPTPIPVPTVSGGHVRATLENSRATVSVPKGTIIDIGLTTSGPWNMPYSSDSKALPLLSTSSSCDGSVRASFRAEGSGWIEAETNRGGGGKGVADFLFRLNVVVLS